MPVTPNGDATAKVLVVDDEELLADLLTEWVQEKWECETVTSGSDGLDTLDETFDVVVLDRKMPGMRGEAVLEEIRAAGHSVQVVLTSSIEPDFDLIDLPLNDYLYKPIDRPALQAQIEELLLRRTYLPTVRQFFDCAAKIAIIEESLPPTKVAENEAYLELRQRADELRQDADATLGDVSEPVATIVDAELDD